MIKSTDFDKPSFQFSEAVSVSDAVSRLPIADSRNKNTTLNIAIEFYQMCNTFKLTGDARNQLDRAARSIALNLGEGRGRKTRKEQRRFFQIAFGSLRECQTLFRLERLEGTEAWQVLDKLGAHLYRLLQRA